MTTHNDTKARELAIQPDQSFIVQAPAGSGKTELLTQRVLKLLSLVQAPEEIIAITFTRKAAGEMRHRILNALAMAQHEPPPSEAHKQHTYKLAIAALKRDQALEWSILQNPNRLRILTIDALAGFLSAHTPLLSGFGARPDISTDPHTLYEQAVLTLIAETDATSPWHDALQTVLLHLDNQLDRVTTLLCQILSKREQWLPHIFRFRQDPAAQHRHLKESLHHVTSDSIQTLSANLGERQATLWSLAQFAADMLGHPPLKPLTADHHSLSDWQRLCDLVLTQSDQWRRRLTKREGFEPKAAEKATLAALIEAFDNEGLLDDFTAVRHAPPSEYPPSQAQMIDALCMLLPLLCAQLNLVFQTQRSVDFIELSLAATRALGDADAPTDLALYLDYQIQHLLIDEFQDTSLTQFGLIEQLVQGWEPDDGRTLFLVGDPMQSIYRFRDAEVGLFLRTQQHGIRDVNLTPLQLTRNFRSDTSIIDWINHHFQTIFPLHDDISSGAVSYAPSQPTQTYQSQGVQTHWLETHETTDEAQHVVDLIKSLQHQHPNESIAILVRSRRHLNAITANLTQRGLPYQGIDLQPLNACPFVKDMLTLTRALQHRGDRIAWLALLRTPVIGLTLADCHTIANTDAQQSICATLLSETTSLIISDDGYQRLQSLILLLIQYEQHVGQHPFDLTLGAIWQGLGFDALMTQPQQRNIETYLSLVSQLLEQHGQLDISHLERQLEKTFIEAASEKTALSIMTMHKSKGLEFDHVILPGLHHTAGKTTHELMSWLERPTLDGGTDFILAPIKPSHTARDPIYHYLQRTEKLKLDHEIRRLLYVAVTRAKRSLHLVACAEPSNENTPSFKSQSFAQMLSTSFQASITPASASTPLPTQRTTAQRAPTHWVKPLIPNPMPMIEENPLPEDQVISKRLIGTAIHAWLADMNRDNWTSQHWEQHFQHLGLPKQCHGLAFEMIESVKSQCMNEPRARWILDHSHQDSYFEYPVTLRQGKHAKQYVIDRTFVDQGVRWVIDYKTSSPSDESPELFMQHEWEAYQNQLATYARAMSALYDEPVKAALYFPLFGGWIEQAAPDLCELPESDLSQ